MATFAGTLPIADLELATIEKFVSHGQAVVDISNGTSEWLDAVLSRFRNMRALLYSSPEAEESALKAASDGSAAARVVEVGTHGANLDGDARAEGIRHIHFLRIAPANRVQRVLKGAIGLLRHSRIDYIQFPLDTWDIWTGQVVGKTLVENAYRLYTMELGHDGNVRLVSFAEWNPKRSHDMVSMLAVQERLIPLLASLPPSDWFVDPYSLALQHGVALKGVINVGAYDGRSEVELYRRHRFQACLMIEANPVVFGRLETACQGRPEFILANETILDKAGPVEFHIVGFDQSSSLLKESTHRQILLGETRTIQMDGITLDQLLIERNLDPAQFNVMSIDIEGAELLALRGANETLKHIDLLMTEVEFENLHDGAAHVDELDDYLAGFGFRRVFTASWMSPSRAEAVYAKFNVPVRSLAGLPPFLSQGSFLKTNSEKSALLRAFHSASISKPQPRFRYPVKAEVGTFWGGVMTVTLPEEVSLNIALLGLYERDLTHILIECLDRDMVFFDIGAHYGYFTLLAQHIVGPGGRVHCFEPTKETYGLLVENTRGKQNITVNNKAVYSKTTELSFQNLGVSHCAYNSIFAPRIHPQAAEHLEVEIELVPAVSIDDYVETTGVIPNFVKVDAESAEFQILEGMRETLARHRPIFTVEVGDKDIEGVCPSKDLVDHALSFGYRVFSSSNGVVMPHQVQQRYVYDNLLFFPEENK